MSDIFNEWVNNNLPQFVIIVILLVAGVVFLVWWARGVWINVKKIDELPCNEHTDKINKFSSDYNSFLVDMVTLTTSMKFMQKSIDGLTSLIRPDMGKSGFIMTKSPISITSEGYAMVDKLGIKGMIDANWSRISNFLEETAASKNPYDIQQYCIEQTVVYPEKFLTKEEIDILKMDAYNKGLPLIVYQNVVAILIRDRYFSEHGLDVSEIDSHSPRGRE